MLSSTAKAATGPAEQATDKAVKLSVGQKFCDAMQARDAAGIAAVFQPGTQLAIGAPRKDGPK